tara:strand:- start:2433 stop:3425 length:993 start_codon:yes stop_codon:yes gene_type:complete
MNILVTGSAGFLGSPLSFNLLQMGHKIIGVDNYLNSNDQSTKILKKYFKDGFIFYNFNLANNIYKLDQVFLKHKPDLVVHFAALKSVEESLNKPELYWENNVQSTKNILNSMANYSCNKIIYSSSAAVYGNQKIQPIKEDQLLNPISVYAKTKASCEKIIKEANANFKIDGISLRYFNPIGFHSSNLFKDKLIEDEGSIINEIIKVALNKNKTLKIYGKEYSTKDGTCERDFIHIDDLLDAHEKSIAFITKFKGYEVFNVGTGNAVSIIDLVNNFIEHNQVTVNYKFFDRRDGDVQTSYADIKKINSMMNWKSKKGLKDMVQDSWRAYSH